MRRFEEGPLHTEQEMIQAIENHLVHMKAYEMWMIGLTADPDRRYEELEEPAFWCHWRAADPEVARRVMEHFVAKGMKPHTPVPPNAVCVYIY